MLIKIWEEGILSFIILMLICNLVSAGDACYFAIAVKGQDPVGEGIFIQLDGKTYARIIEIGNKSHVSEITDGLHYEGSDIKVLYLFKTTLGT